jgi:hypothetical protein
VKALEGGWYAHGSGLLRLAVIHERGRYVPLCNVLLKAVPGARYSPFVQSATEIVIATFLAGVSYRCGHQRVASVSGLKKPKNEPH